IVQLHRVNGAPDVFTQIFHRCVRRTLLAIRAVVAEHITDREEQRYPFWYLTGACRLGTRRNRNHCAQEPDGTTLPNHAIPPALVDQRVLCRWDGKRPLPPPRSKPA